MASRLAAFGLGGELGRYVDGLGPPERIPIPLLMTLARQCSLAGDQHRALCLLDEVHRGDPEFPPGLLARAQVLMYMGRLQDAIGDVDRCLQRAPGIAHAHWLRSRLGTEGLEPDYPWRLQERLARADTSAQDRAFLGFALHALLDDRGDHAGAWMALEHGCRAKRGLLEHDADAVRQLVDALVAMPVPPAPVAATGHAKVPIFVVGMHRSGTTLLETLLGAHPQVRGVGECYDFTAAMRLATDHACRGVVDATIVARAPGLDFEQVGRDYLDSMAWRLGGEPFFVDKLPSNFLNLGFICRALPQARILHMVRDPMETCFSNLRELFSDANAYSYDQRELGGYFLQYRRLMAHWHAVYPDRILDVPLTALVDDSAAQMQRIIAFCGIDGAPAHAKAPRGGRAVATASAVQVRRAISRPAVPQWRAYAEELRPLASALGD